MKSGLHTRQRWVQVGYDSATNGTSSTQRDESHSISHTERTAIALVMKNPVVCTTVEIGVVFNRNPDHYILNKQKWLTLSSTALKVHFKP